MGRERKNELRTEQFAKWVKHETTLPAWQALTFPARVAYMHVKILCFAETAAKKKKLHKNNNGHVSMSPKRLAEQMGCSEKTASAALADLQAKGWIVCTKLGHLGVDGQGVSSSWRLTMMATADGPPTREARAWAEGKDYEVIAYPKAKPKPRKGRADNFTKNSTPPPIRGQVHLLFGG